MSKAVTIASLTRAAARDEAEFASTVQSVIDDCDHARTAEFFDRFNIPRSVGLSAPGHKDPLPAIKIRPEHIGTFEEEGEISEGIQKFLERHHRKLKWHASHPSLEGAENLMLLYRAAIVCTMIRLQRLDYLLATKTELTPRDWWVAREMMNKSYLGMLNYLDQLSGAWADAMLATFPRDEVLERVGGFYEIVDAMVRYLEQHRDRIEARRQQLAVLPEGFPPVKPPVYFGGDLMGTGPWNYFWNNLMAKAHLFRETLG
jgi:hypothetical protein